MNTHIAKRLAERENVELSLEHKQKLLDFEQGKKLTTKDKLFILRMCEKHPDMVKDFIKDHVELWQKLQTTEPELAEMIKKKLIK